MPSRYLGFVMLAAPFIPLLVRSQRTKKPAPDLEAVDRMLERIRRGPVTLNPDEEVALREVLAFVGEQGAMPDRVQWAMRRLREVERRCAC